LPSKREFFNAPSLRTARARANIGNLPLIADVGLRGELLADAGRRSGPHLERTIDPREANNSAPKNAPKSQFWAFQAETARPQNIIIYLDFLGIAWWAHKDSNLGPAD
jgi:hypothetical protein